MVLSGRVFVIYVVDVDIPWHAWHPSNTRFSRRESHQSGDVLPNKWVVIFLLPGYLITFAGGGGLYNRWKMVGRALRL